MAKGQKRSNKEPKKQKSGDKKKAEPKYLRSSDLGQSAKLGTTRGGQNK